MRIALFKGKSLISSLIKWQSRSAYSHAAIVDDFGHVWESREGKGVQWMESVSASDACPVDLFYVATTPEQDAQILSFLKAQEGKPYDWTMVLRFISRRQASREQAGKWFCSELVFAAFQAAGVQLLQRVEPWAVSPGLLALSPMLMDQPYGKTISVSANAEATQIGEANSP